MVLYHHMLFVYSIKATLISLQSSLPAVPVRGEGKKSGLLPAACCITCLCFVTWHISSEFHVLYIAASTSFIILVSALFFRPFFYIFGSLSLLPLCLYAGSLIQSGFLTRPFLASSSVAVSWGPDCFYTNSEANE